MTADITTLDALDALYGRGPSEAARIKVTSVLTPSYHNWIAASRFCVLSTVGPEGVDGSPRGDVGPVVEIVDNKTLHLPDWRGNNRLDSLRNIVRDPRVSVMFFVVGSDLALRVNGRARIRADASVIEKFEQNAKHPTSVIEITIEEVYAQCSKSIMRSELWSVADQSQGLPSLGQMIKDAKASFDAEEFDAAWHDRASKTLW